MRKWALLTTVLLLVMGLARDAALTKKDEPGQAYDPERKWSVEELKEDLSILRGSLEEGHAGLYRYSTKMEMDGLFDDTARALTKPLTELEFMRRVAPLLRPCTAATRDLASPKCSLQIWKSGRSIFPWG